jgi:hypothetical protein
VVEVGLELVLAAAGSGDERLASAGACVVAPLYAQLVLSCQPHRRPLLSYTLVEGVGVPLQAGALSHITGPGEEEGASVALPVEEVGEGDGLGLSSRRCDGLVPELVLPDAGSGDGGSGGEGLGLSSGLGEGLMAELALLVAGSGMGEGLGLSPVV